MKYKIIYPLVAAFAVAGPAVVSARGSEEIPIQMMEQMFKGTPFGDVLDSVPRKDRDRSKGDRDRSRDRDSSGRRELSDDRGGEDSYRRRGGRDRGYDDGGDDRLPRQHAPRLHCDRH